MLRAIQTILFQDQIQLETSLGLDSSASRIEVQCLLQHTLGVTRAYLFAHPERLLSDSETAAYQTLFMRRLGGEPIAYILGEREFFGLKFKVTPDTLIPRPDTELLVELALARIPFTPFALLPPPRGEGWGEGNFSVLDLGTGNGAIALAIAHQRSNAKVWACDASASALAVAQENAQDLGITNVQFVESDWFSSLTGQRFDVIVSNPPYVASGDQHLLEGDVRFEPITALASGSDGLDDIRNIVAQAGSHLRQNGWLLLEHGYDQADRVRKLLLYSGFSSVYSAKDLASIERCSGGQRL
jgi:release factor glutamine methyltransferase